MHFHSLWISGALLCAAASPSVKAAAIINGGFESGFSGWTRVDQLGSDGTFTLQTGTSSPVNSFAVPAPPGGTTAAMTDAQGPGSHVLYQDFVVDGIVTDVSLAFSLFVNNAFAPNFFIPNTLDFATPALNQRARVDITTASADPFSFASGDILQTLFETKPGDPLVSGYNSYSVDISAVLQANAGSTLRLRFVDVDNVGPFNLGVDNVRIQAASASVPDALPAWVPCLSILGVVAAGAARQCKKAAAGETVSVMA